MRTQHERENLALVNLARRETLTVGQLRCARVNTNALFSLEDAGAIEWGDDVRLTDQGRAELNARMAAGNLTTIGGAA